jgi:hypothetical protein
MTDGKDESSRGYNIPRLIVMRQSDAEKKKGRLLSYLNPAQRPRAGALNAGVAVI